MDPLIKELRDLIEQTEPYQRKMKAKHSRLKKRVIGHGGQKAGPPYSIKPSMKRSKSAPPIGEGIFDTIKKKLGVSPSDSSKFNKIANSNIYVGMQPLMDGNIDSNIVDKFDKVYLVAEETVERLSADDTRKYQDKIVTCSTKDTDVPTNEQISVMERTALEISRQPKDVVILVACKAGLNRSAAIAARALVLREGITSVKDDVEEQKAEQIIQSVISARSAAASSLGAPGVLTYDARSGTTGREKHGKQHEAFINFIKFGTSTNPLKERKIAGITQKLVEQMLREVIRETMRR